MEVKEIRKSAKDAGISGSELLACKRDLEANYQAEQNFIDDIRRTAFRNLTGRNDRFWMIFGHESCPQFGKMFHGGGDYTTIRGWDVAARSVFFECPGLCSCEEDASEALWNFVRYQPFRIPTNAELYSEAFKMILNSGGKADDDSYGDTEERTEDCEFFVGSSVPF